MLRKQLQSTTIASVGFDATSNTLEIEFHNGGVYQYFDVPESVYDQLVSAPSAGRFLAEQVKGVFRYGRT